MMQIKMRILDAYSEEYKRMDKMLIFDDYHDVRFRCKMSKCIDSRGRVSSDNYIDFSDVIYDHYMRGNLKFSHKQYCSGSGGHNQSFGCDNFIAAEIEIVTGKN